MHYIIRQIIWFFDYKFHFANSDKVSFKEINRFFRKKLRLAEYKDRFPNLYKSFTVKNKDGDDIYVAINEFWHHGQGQYLRTVDYSFEGNIFSSSIEPLPLGGGTKQFRHASFDRFLVEVNRIAYNKPVFIIPQPITYIKL